MVDARLEVLIVARNQIRGTLNEVQGQIDRLRGSAQRLNQTRTTRVQGEFARLRDQIRQAEAQLVVARSRVGQLNRARLATLNAQIRATGMAASGAAVGVRALVRALAPFIGAAAIVIGLIRTVGVLAQFEQQMAAVAAITGATGAEFAALEGEARRLGATTRFTASQAAEGLEFLARAGFESADAVQALEGTLNLASAGMLDLGEAADIASNIITQFALAASETTSIADILALTAASANTNVRQLGDAFKFVGPVARSLNITVEDTSALLGALGNAGIQASNAGAGLRRVLVGLTNTTPKSEAALKTLGLTVADINPEANSLFDVFEKLRDGQLDLNRAVDIFGIRGATVALSLASLSDEARELALQTNNADGASKNISETIEDTLLGDFRRLISAFQEVVLQGGDAGLIGVFRGIVTTLTDFVRALGGSEDATSEFGRVLRNLLVTGRELFRVFAPLIEAVFAPLALALKFLATVASTVSELIDGIRAKALELGAVPRDVSNAVNASVEFLNKRFSEATEENLETLDKFIAGTKSRIRTLQEDIRQTGAQVGAGEISDAEAARRFQNLNESLNREVGILQGAGARRRSIIAGLAKAETDAKSKELSQQLDDLVAERQAELDAIERFNRLAAAEAESQVTLLRAQASTIEAENRAREAAGLEALEGNQARRRELLRRALQLEIDERTRARRAVDALEAAAIQVEEDPAVEADIRAKAAIDRVKAQTELDAKVQEQLQQSAKFAEEDAKARQVVAKAVQDARDIISREAVEVEDFTVIRERLQREFDETLRNLEVSAEDAEIIEKAIDIDAANEAIAQVEAAVTASQERLATQAALIQNQVLTGQITEQEGIARSNEAREAAQDQQLAFIEQLRLADPGTFTEDQIAQIELLEASILRVVDVVGPQITQLTTALQQAGEQFFNDIISGTKTAEEAFKAFAVSVLKEIQKIIVQQLVLKAIQAASGGIGALGRAITVKEGGLIMFKQGGLVPKFAAGGEVTGPGNATSDSITARLSRGEYVVPAFATRQYLPFLEAMRQGVFHKILGGKGITLGPIRIPNIPTFQGGGLVEPSQTTQTSGEQRSLRIINIPDQSLTRDFLTSSEGEDVILNLITNRAENIKRLLS